MYDPKSAGAVNRKQHRAPPDVWMGSIPEVSFSGARWEPLKWAAGQKVVVAGASSRGVSSLAESR